MGSTHCTNERILGIEASGYKSARQKSDLSVGVDCTIQNNGRLAKAGGGSRRHQ